MASKKKVIQGGVDVQTAAGVSALVVNETTGAVTAGPATSSNTPMQFPVCSGAKMSAMQGGDRVTLAAGGALTFQLPNASFTGGLVLITAHGVAAAATALMLVGNSTPAEVLISQVSNGFTFTITTPSANQIQVTYNRNPPVITVTANATIPASATIQLTFIGNI
jgi:hypothetical protein